MKKILILGAPGSGKSFVGKKLSEKLNIPLYHLDNYYYKPNWLPVSPEEFAEKQREIIMTDAWIIDGNSVRMLAERLRYADTVIFLDIPLRHRMARIIKRDCNPWSKNRNLPIGCSFSVRQFIHFFIEFVIKWNKRDAIVKIINQNPHVTFYHIHHSHEINKLLQKLSTQ